MPKYFPCSASLYVWLLLLSAFWNILVWAAVSAVIVTFWHNAAAWSEASQYMAVYMVSWEAMIFVRACSRKATTAFLTPSDPRIRPLVPLGLAFDLIIWNGSQMVAACKMLQIDYNDAELAVAMGIGEDAARQLATAVVVMAWTLFWDSVLRFSWPMLAWMLHDEFQKGAAMTIVYTLPELQGTKECSICLEESTNDLCVMPCGHCFHRECLSSWFQTNGCNFGAYQRRNNSCPLCRRELRQLGDGTKVVLSTQLQHSAAEQPEQPCAPQFPTMPFQSSPMQLPAEETSRDIEAQQPTQAQPGAPSTTDDALFLERQCEEMERRLQELQRAQTRQQQEERTTPVVP